MRQRWREAGDVPCPLLEVFSAMLLGLLPSLFLRLSISLVELEKDKMNTKKKLGSFLPFCCHLCFLGCAISPTLTSPIRAGWPLITAGAAPFLGSVGSLMQCSSIYHSALGRLKKRKKDKPSLHRIKEKFTLM